MRNCSATAAMDITYFFVIWLPFFYCILLFHQKILKILILGTFIHTAMAVPMTDSHGRPEENMAITPKAIIRQPFPLHALHPIALQLNVQYRQPIFFCIVLTRKYDIVLEYLFEHCSTVLSWPDAYRTFIICLICLIMQVEEKPSLFCSFSVPNYTIRKSTSQWFCPPLSKPFRKPLKQQAIKFRNIGCLIWCFPLRQHDF